MPQIVNSSSTKRKCQSTAYPKKNGFGLKRLCIDIFSTTVHLDIDFLVLTWLVHHVTQSICTNPIGLFVRAYCTHFVYKTCTKSATQNIESEASTRRSRNRICGSLRTHKSHRLAFYFKALGISLHAVERQWENRRKQQLKSKTRTLPNRHRHSRNVESCRHVSFCFR